METAAAPRVQALADAGVSRLPAQYIQPPDLRPAPSHRPPAASLSVPVVDLSAGAAAADAVRGACAEWGAFHVVNHGVPPGLLDAMRGAGLAFFCAPMEDKLRFGCDPAKGAAAEGYGSRMLANDDSVLDWRDYFDHHTLPESRRDPAHWPDFVPGYRDTVVKYSNSMKGLAQRLLSIISESLNLPPSYIEEAVGEVYQNITISYYSPCPQPDLALGFQSHSDMGAITLLIQDDVSGLEVLKDGMWIPVPPLSDGILVILSDQTELVSKEHPQKYRDVIYGDYVSSWYSKGPEGKRNIDALLIEQ